MLFRISKKSKSLCSATGWPFRTFIIEYRNVNKTWNCVLSCVFYFTFLRQLLLVIRVSNEPIFFYCHPVVSQSHNILNRGSMFAIQWREFSPPLSYAHRLLQCYHSQWEIGNAAIPEEFPLSPATRAISQWGRSLEWRCTFWFGKFA